MSQNKTKQFKYISRIYERKEKKLHKIKQLRCYCFRKVKKNTNRHILYNYMLCDIIYVFTRKNVKIYLPRKKIKFPLGRSLGK